MWTDFLNACFQWGAQSVTYLWLPVLAWSLLCGLVLHMGDRFRRLRLSYAGLYSLLLMLPLGIVLNGLIRLVPSAPAAEQLVASSEIVTATPLVLSEPVLTASTSLWLPIMTNLLMGMLILAAVVALGAMLLSVLRALRLLATSWMLPQSVTSAVVPAAVLDEVATQARRLGIRRPIRVEVSNTLTSPHTYGWRSPALILPASLADSPDELRMACLHELAHIQRHDFVLHWLDLFISEVFFFAPMVRRVRARLHLHREQACDRAVLTHSGISARRYAQFLLQYVTASSPRPVLALTMHAPDSELKQRVRAMKDQSSSRTLTPMQTGLLVALLMASAAALIVAISQALSPNAPQLESEVPVITEQPLIEEEIPLDNSETFVIVEEMPQLIGGLSGLQETLRYPRIAKEAGVSGRVFVQFVVSSDGTVRDAIITRGIGAGCDEEALRAVRAAQFIPGKQRGRAVPVKMSLPVTFRLDNEEATTGIGDVVLEESRIDLKVSRIVFRKDSSVGSSTFSITGFVRDAATGRALVGANIWIPEAEKGAVSDPNGAFTISGVDSRAQPLQVSFVGYRSLTYQIPIQTESTEATKRAALDAISEMLSRRDEHREQTRALIDQERAIHEQALEQLDTITATSRLEIVNLEAVITTDFSGNRFQTLSGVVRDAESEQVIAGAHVHLATDATIGASTNLKGEFKIGQVPLGKHSIQAAFVGYKGVMTRAIGQEALALNRAVTEQEAQNPTARIEIVDLKSEIVGESQKISGTVRDAATKQVLPGAQLILEESQQGSVTSMQGEFTILNVRPGQYTLRGQFIGYEHLIVENVGKTE